MNVFEQRFSVLDGKASGPRPALSDALALECIHLLLSGYKTPAGQQRYFRSITQAVQRNERLREIMANAGIDKPAALLRRLKHQQPNLQRRRQRYVFQYGPSNKQERALYCQMMLWLPATIMMQLLSQVIWIDAKKLWVSPKDDFVYAPKDADLYIEHPHARGGKGRSICIHYYIAVSAVLGGFLFVPVTGTTGLVELGGRSYTVRGGSACCATYLAAPSNACEAVHFMNQQWGFRCTWFMAHCSKLAHCLSSAW